jgi:hypothetical protein
MQATTDKRPEWARTLRLPAQEELAYVQTLAIASAAVALAAYLAVRVVSDPRAAVKAARKRTGV